MKLKLPPLSWPKSYLPLFLLALGLSLGELPVQAQVEDMTPSTPPETQSSQAQLQQIQKQAEEIINWLEEGEFAKVREVLAPQLQSEWSTEKIEGVWEDLLAETGPLKRMVDLNALETINSDLVLATLEFENATRKLIFMFDRDRQIIGVDFPATESVEEIATKFVNDLANQDFASARGYLHPYLKEEIFPEQIRDKWQRLLSKTGPFQKIVTTQIRKGSDVDNIDLVLVTVQFAKVTDDLIVVFDRDKKITNVDAIDVGS